MNKLYYPAVFQKEKVGFSVWLPDISGCISQGDDLQEAIENIKEALGLYFEDYKENKIVFPVPSAPDSISLDENQFIAIVEFDSLDYLKKHDNKAVKKTLTIPSWLNEQAEENHINFSSVLQTALKQKLNIN